MANGGLEQRVASLEKQMQDLTNIVQQLAQAQVTTQQQLDRTIVVVNEASAIARSNARSIAAWEALIQQNKDEAEEELSRQAVWIRDLQEANRENVLQHMEFRQNHTDALRRFDENQRRFDENQRRFDENQRRFDENQRRFDETQAAINRILDILGS